MNNILNTLLENLSFIGKNYIPKLKKLRLHTVRDLVFYAPRYYKIKQYNPNLSTYLPNENQETIILTGTIINKQSSFYKKPVKILFQCQQDHMIELIFFNKLPPFIYNFLYTGKVCIVEGVVKSLGVHKWQISHPSFIFSQDKIKIVEPIYNLTYGLCNYTLHNFIIKTYKMVLPIIEQYTKEYSKLAIMYNWPSMLESVSTIHNIENKSDILPYVQNAIKRLSIDELIAHHIGLGNIASKRYKNTVFNEDNVTQNKLLSLLPFDLTTEQQSILSQIKIMQHDTKQMVALLQGDVGSGKTIIAVISMLSVIASNKQIAIMAPTELLAKQHYEYIEKYLKQLDIKCKLLTGAIKQKNKKQTLQEINSGEINVVIGTHAIFQEKVLFNNLGYIVIDEQHRFGVMQRLQLIKKSHCIADVLLMSATPIPRSLMMTLFGRVKILTLNNTIKNRKPILTYTLPNTEEHNVYDFMKKILSKKEKIYWICPLITQQDQETTSINEISNVETRYTYLSKIFPEDVAMLHGKMKMEEKDNVMNQFADNKVNILVATTVIEVGINIPSATLIIIENAEKFGLAQLHQLRGRVGRSDLQSYCILMYDNKKLSKISMQRLQIIKNMRDGFEIAKQDLEIRGGGNILGTEQSGTPDFFFANKMDDKEEIFTEVINTAEELKKNNEACKYYMNLFPFEKDVSIS